MLTPFLSLGSQQKTGIINNKLLHNLLLGNTLFKIKNYALLEISGANKVEKYQPRNTTFEGNYGQIFASLFGSEMVKSDCFWGFY